MPTLSFRFRNTQDDQTFSVDDQVDTSHNPIFNSPVNRYTYSDWIQCWQGSDGKGRVSVKGDKSMGLMQDIDNDQFEFDY